MNRKPRNFLFWGCACAPGGSPPGRRPAWELIRRGRAALALWTKGGASANTLKRLSDACRSHDTPLYALSPGALGHSIGKPSRMTVAVAPDGMADKAAGNAQGPTRL